MADKYGIPPGGDPYPGKIKYLGDNRRRLNAREVYAVTKATWPEGKQEIAAAVALAESNGSPFVYNTYKQGHFGLFQISRSAWPEFFADDSWADPEKNSAKAYEIYQKQGWGAWQGYTDKGWEKHRNEVAAAALRYDGKPLGGLLDDIKSQGIASVVGNAAVAVGEAAGTAVGKVTGLDVLSDAYKAVTTPAFWMRVAYGITGVVLVVGGLMLVVRNTPAARKTASAVASVTPAGKALKGVTK